MLSFATWLFSLQRKPDTFQENPVALRAVKQRAGGRIVFTCCEFFSEFWWLQLSRTLWCGKVLLDPSTSAILLDQSTGQQQLNVTAGILAPKAPLGLIDEWIAKAPSHRTFKKPLFAKIRFLGKCSPSFTKCTWPCRILFAFSLSGVRSA